MKKLLAMLLTLTMVLSLAACGGNDHTADKGGNNASNSTTDANKGQENKTENNAAAEKGDGDKKEENDGKMPESGAAGSETGTQGGQKPAEAVITLNHTDVTMFSAGETFRLSPRGITGVYAATFTSEDETIASVDSNGIVTAVAPGTTKVLVHIEGNGAQYDGSCIVRCSWKAEDEQPAEQPDSSQPGQTEPVGGADLQAFYTQMTGTYEFGFLEQLTGDILENFYPGMSAVSTKQCMVMGSMMTMNNGEFGLVEVSDGKDVDAVKAIFQARVDYMIQGGAFYPSAEDQWTNNSRVVSNGNYVMMIVHEKCDDIVAAFNNYVA